MNQSNASAALVRLSAIEEEVALLRRKLESNPERKVTLEGIWSDVEITDAEIEEVKNSWMKKLDDIV